MSDQQSNIPSSLSSAVRPQPRRVMFHLIASVIGSVLLVSAIAAIGIVSLGYSTSWSGWLAASLISLFAAGVSLAVITPGLFFGMQTSAQAFLASGVLRTLATLAGCIGGVVILKDHATAMLVIIIPMYFAQLLAEAIVLAVAYWPHKKMAEELS